MTHLSRKGLIIAAFLLSSFSYFSNAQQTSQPACQSEEYQQFNFWIGQWDVFDANGKLVGHNTIKPVLNGCALSENWQSASGNLGVSYNFFDSAENQWHQTWVDQSGGALYLNGNLENGKMVLQGERPAPDGGKVLHKISWTPLDDGRVKQHWQVSKDLGKTWAELFLGFYKKK